MAIVAAVVLVARTLAYALAPDPRAEALGRVTGGPRPVIAGAISLALALTAAGAVLWVSALGVRERHLLRPVGPAPRLRIVPALGRAVALAVASVAVFAALETAIHVREGLGFHGLSCLTGPVHVNALPLLTALSLVAAAVVEAVRHAVSYGRRVLDARPARARVPRSAHVRPPAADPSRLLAVPVRPVLRGRGPPVCPSSG